MKSQPVPDALAVELVRHLNAAARRCMLRPARGGRPAEVALTRSEVPVIAVLGEAGGCTMGALAEAVMRAVSSLTPVVDRLEAKGLAARRRDPGDRRTVHVGLTPRGRALYGHMRASRLAMARAMLAALDGAERDTFLGLMRRIAAGVEGGAGP